MRQPAAVRRYTLVATVGAGCASGLTSGSVKRSNTLCTASIMPLIATCCSIDSLARGPPAKMRAQLAHLVLTGQAATRRVHADDLLVLGPDRHHALEVAALEGFVEGVLRVLRGRKNLSAHERLRTAPSTVSTESSFIQRK